MKTFLRVVSLLLVVAIFAGFNLILFFFVTRRISNNFSDASQLKMIEVENYLPFEDGSDVVHVDTSFELTDNLPVLDGAAALLPVYASIIENVYPEGCVTYEGGVFSGDNYYGENFADDSAMQYFNTVRGYKAIVDGTTDILFCAGPSEEQKQYAEEQGVELIYVPIGLEAFVFFVNEQNPVNDLTADQIRGIYSGKYRNWSEVNGPNRMINPVLRISGSGSQTTMDKFMGEVPYAKKSPFALFGGSLGFSFRFYLDGIVQNNDVKMLSLNGIEPSKENITNRTYPIVSEFYAIYRADNTNENIAPLIDWILSDEGQRLIEECGYVGIA